MNWLIWDKMFTYFYNKFRPLNHMYYIKCGVKSSLPNSGCCIRSVAPWITVLSRHTVFTKEGDILQIYFCAIPRNMALRTGPCHVWCTVCSFFGCEKNTDGSAGGLVILLASVCCGDFCWGLLLLLLLFLFFFLLKIVFHIASLHNWFPKLVSATRISLLASSSSFIYFFRPLLDTHNHLPCLDYYVWLGTVAET